MAQITTTKDRQPADAERDLAAKGQGATLRLVQKTAPTATRHPASGSAAAEMIRGSGTLVHFWLEQANKQVADTAQTLRKLAAASGWRERLEIQNAFVSGSLTWLNEGMARCTRVAASLPSCSTSGSGRPGTSPSSGGWRSQVSSRSHR